jgi:hypothetical protein
MEMRKTVACMTKIHTEKGKREEEEKFFLASKTKAKPASNQKGTGDVHAF